MEHKDVVEALKEYKELLDTGVITQSDYDRKKEELLNIPSSGPADNQTEAVKAEKSLPAVDVTKAAGLVKKIFSNKFVLIGVIAAVIVLIIIVAVVKSAPTASEKALESQYITVIQDYIDKGFYNSAVSAADEGLVLLKSSEIEKLKKTAEKMTKESNEKSADKTEKSGENGEEKGNSESNTELIDYVITEEDVKGAFSEFAGLITTWYNEASALSMIDQSQYIEVDGYYAHPVYENDRVDSADDIKDLFLEYCTEDVYNTIVSHTEFKYEDINGKLYFVPTQPESSGFQHTVNDIQVTKESDNKYTVICTDSVQNFEAIGERKIKLTYTKQNEGYWVFDSIEYGEYEFDINPEYDDNSHDSYENNAANDAVNDAVNAGVKIANDVLNSIF